MEGTKFFLPKIAQTLDGWAKEDPPTVKKLPVEVDVVEWLVRCGMEPGADEKTRATGRD